MPTLDLDTDASAISARLADPKTLLVACLCAEWCGTCREYRVMFDVLADSHPAACFVWIDIETHSELVDDYDVENFPTILIEDGVSTRFFGTVLPQRRIIERMIEEFSGAAGSPGALKLRPALAGNHTAS
jgi:thioredoxin 1